MRLVTYSRRGQPARIGARLDNGIVDLNLAYAALAREQGVPANVAAERVPTDMRQLFEGGDRSLAAARETVEFARELGLAAIASQFVVPASAAKIHAPIIPRKFFHTAGNFREHHEEAVKAGFSHPVMPWIVFFQNIDAIIGPDEPVIYPSHLTEELDYELELAVVVKKAGKHFTAEQAQ